VQGSQDRGHDADHALAAFVHAGQDTSFAVCSPGQDTRISAAQQSLADAEGLKLRKAAKWAPNAARK